jgi:hypothetical protein
VVIKAYQRVDDTEANHLKEQEVGMKTLLKFKSVLRRQRKEVTSVLWLLRAVASLTVQ